MTTITLQELKDASAYREDLVEQYYETYLRGIQKAVDSSLCKDATLDLAKRLFSPVIEGNDLVAELPTGVKVVTYEGDEMHAYLSCLLDAKQEEAREEEQDAGIEFDKLLAKRMLTCLDTGYARNIPDRIVYNVGSHYSTLAWEIAKKVCADTQEFGKIFYVCEMVLAMSAPRPAQKPNNHGKIAYEKLDDYARVIADSQPVLRFSRWADWYLGTVVEIIFSLYSVSPDALVGGGGSENFAAREVLAEFFTRDGVDVNQ